MCGVNGSKYWFAPVLMCTVALAPCLVGCPSGPSPLPPGDTRSDPTNGGATYVGSAACQTCHANFTAATVLHGHTHILNETQGQPPVYPAEAPLAGVSAPPPGAQWTDVSYVIGGYLKAANFVDLDGFVLTNTATARPFQYNLQFPANGTVTGYEPAATTGLTPYDFQCFRCHTTGPLSITDNGGRRQGNRPGIGGTWAENGVRCEACHGPGSRHIPNPEAGNIFVLGVADACNRCHAGFDGDTSRIEASGGFIVGNQQASELAASPHAGFDCTFCHDPHQSSVRDTGIRNNCQACHPDKDLALHEGKVFAQGDYVEVLDCTSCHMPFASQYAHSATPAFTGGNPGRIGDTRTHIFRIDPNEGSFATFFNPSGSLVQTDAGGQAAVTLDFVCLRCHNGQGSAFSLRLSAASGIAPGIHQARIPE